MEVVFKDAGFEKLYLKEGGLEREYPGHFHPLRGDRDGEWACSLDQPYRLIFSYVPEDKVIIIEIVNYHGK